MNYIVIGKIARITEIGFNLLSITVAEYRKGYKTKTETVSDSAMYWKMFTSNKSRISYIKNNFKVGNIVTATGFAYLTKNKETGNLSTYFDIRTLDLFNIQMEKSLDLAKYNNKDIEKPNLTITDDF